MDDRADRELTEQRITGRPAFIDRMHREGRRTVLEVGCGPGRDGRDFADASFDAGWTMSTLLHVANADFDLAMAEIVRVLRPGAPLAIGTWGSAVSREEYWSGGGEFGPPRFASIRSDQTLQQALRRFGSVEEVSTWAREAEGHYQWVVLRAPQ